MARLRLKEKGVALFVILGTILIVILLGNVILVIISSQSRLTHHQVSRIKAYYAAMAGVNLALERLRTGAWSPGNYTLCQSGCDFNDTDIPYMVNIGIGNTSPNGISPINATVDYTYIPP